MKTNSSVLTISSLYCITKHECVLLSASSGHEVMCECCWNDVTARNVLCVQEFFLYPQCVRMQNEQCEFVRLLYSIPAILRSQSTCPEEGLIQPLLIIRNFMRIFLKYIWNCLGSVCKTCVECYVGYNKDSRSFQNGVQQMKWTVIMLNNSESC